MRATPSGILGAMNVGEQAEIQQSSLRQLLANAEVVAFVRALTTESYQAYFHGHEREVGEMVGRAWDLLADDANSGGEHLGRATETIGREIFRIGDPTFWFNVLYKTYKTDVRPRKDFSRLRQYIRGTRVLDFGSGGGYLALRMSENGYQVSTTDVIDYRVDTARHLPFVAMASATDVPYPDNAFDTAIVKAVLHHVDEAVLARVITELHRVSKRLIIEEDTFDVPAEMPGVALLLESQPNLRRFTGLSQADQLRSLMLIDYFANAIAQGIAHMNFPFQFKTITQWRQVLADHGMALAAVELLGFQEGNVNKSCHVWLITDRRAGS